MAPVAHISTVSGRRIKVRKSALCLGLLAFGLLNTLPAFGQQNPVVITRHPATVDSSTFSSLNMKQKHMAFNKLSASTNAATQKQDPRIVSVPNFTRSFTFGGQTFPYTMVGQDPTKAQPTEVPTQYIPMSFFFDEFIDQNGNNIVIDTTAITDEIKHSPLFDSAPFANGFTQYEDAQMRAEFFPLFHNKIHNGGDGDDSFHVLLGHPQTLLPVQIEVPVGSSEVFVDSNGTFFALIDINFIVSQLNTLLQTEPITVQSIPIFLTRNAVYGDFFQQQPVDCCIGGFHTAFETNQINNKIFVQTFAFSTSLDSDVSAAVFGDPTLFADVFALSHELGELLNDPFVNNVTPNYQLPGLPPGACQNNLEVGDLIENLPNPSRPLTLHGFTYHPQTLGLLQWFEGINPSDAFSGDYSFPDSTVLTVKGGTAPFTPCPAPTPAP
jgi:hypothetical protein